MENANALYESYLDQSGSVITPTTGAGGGRKK